MQEKTTAGAERVLSGCCWGRQRALMTVDLRSETTGSG